MADYTELRRLASEATPGPWREGTANVWNDKLLRCVATTKRPIRNGDSWAQHLADAAYIAACDPTTVIALLDEIAELESAHAQLAELYTDLEMTHRKHLEDTAPAFDALKSENRQARTLIHSLATMLDDVVSDGNIQDAIDASRDYDSISVYCAVIDDADCFLSGREYDPDEDTDRQVINPQKTEVK